MKLIGIICEYNPFHKGHEAHIDFTRTILCKNSDNNILQDCDKGVSAAHKRQLSASGAYSDVSDRAENCPLRDDQASLAQSIVCVMSGNFCQRGDAAIADKYSRAAAAIHAGADAVIELPPFFACCNAQVFARGAVRLLAGIEGFSALSFGSECGDIETLKRAAEILDNESPEFKKTLKEKLDSGAGYPQSLAAALGDKELSKIIKEPNNILAVEYIRALKEFAPYAASITLKRLGAGYKDDESADGYISAQGIRRLINENKATEAAENVPGHARDIIDEAVKHPVNYAALYALLRQKINDLSIEELREFADVTEGLEYRLKEKAVISGTYEEFFAAVRSKRYTDSRIRRIFTAILTEITKNDVSKAFSLPPYYNVLAVKKGRTDILSVLPNAYVRNSDYREISDPRLSRLIKIHARCDDVYSILTGRPLDSFYKIGVKKV